MTKTPANARNIADINDAFRFAVIGNFLDRRHDDRLRLSPGVCQLPALVIYELMEDIEACEAATGAHSKGMVQLDDFALIHWRIVHDEAGQPYRLHVMRDTELTLLALRSELEAYLHQP